MSFGRAEMATLVGTLGESLLNDYPYGNGVQVHAYANCNLPSTVLT
jgi:hypothetical protein